MAIELQTDRLRQETGAAEIYCQVIFHNTAQKKRLTIIKSKIGDAEIAQSIAYTRLHPQGWTPQVAAIDCLLAQGALMGETFRHESIEVTQIRLSRCRLPLAKRQWARLFGTRFWTWSEIEAYEFWAGDCLYGTVLEVKNPNRTQAPARPRPATWRARLAGACHTVYLYIHARKTARFLNRFTC